jgi:hypothetical protein
VSLPSQDEEFEGFTQDDIDSTSARLKRLETELSEEKRALAKMSSIKPKKYWPRASMFLQAALKEGNAQPAKVSVHAKVLAAENVKSKKSLQPSTSKKVSPIKLQFKTEKKAGDKEKIRLKKLKEKARLKKLKEKAKIKKLKQKEKKKMKEIRKKIKKLKKKESKVELPASSSDNAAPTKPTEPLNEVAMGFILPSQSSRSSRKIIPSKRLTDYDDAFPVFRKPKAPQPLASPPPPLPPAITTDEVSVIQADQTSKPLEGKRERKPNSRMADMYCGDVVRRKKSTKTILQKAKLRLNQAALNKSKKALAHSLQQQMAVAEEGVFYKSTESNSIFLHCFRGC